MDSSTDFLCKIVSHFSTDVSARPVCLLSPLSYCDLQLTDDNSERNSTLNESGSDLKPVPEWDYLLSPHFW